MYTVCIMFFTGRPAIASRGVACIKKLNKTKQKISGDGFRWCLDNVKTCILMRKHTINEICINICIYYVVVMLVKVVKVLPQLGP